MKPAAAFLIAAALSVSNGSALAQETKFEIMFFEQDGRSLLTIIDNTGQVRNRLPVAERGVTLALSANQDRLVYGSLSSNLYDYDFSTGTSRYLFNSPWTQTISFLPGSSTEFVYNSPYHLTRYDLVSGQQSLWQSTDVLAPFGTNNFRGNGLSWPAAADKVVFTAGIAYGGGNQVYLAEMCNQDQAHHFCNVSTIGPPTSGFDWATANYSGFITPDGTTVYYGRRVDWNQWQLRKRDLSSGSDSVLLSGPTDAYGDGFGPIGIFGDSYIVLVGSGASPNTNDIAVCRIQEPLQCQTVYTSPAHVGYAIVGRAINSRPTAVAGGDQTVEASGPGGAWVSLDGSSSTDPDNDQLTFSWTDEDGQVVGTESAVTVLVPFGVHRYTLTVDDGRGESNSADVVVTVQDTVSPSVSCGQAGGGWHSADVVVACSASDSGSGLQSEADAAFTLSTDVPVGTETADAATGTRIVCDLQGNCVTAGSLSGLMVDKRPPAVAITSPTDGTVTFGATVTAAYSCTDGGSGVASCTGTSANGSNVNTTTPGPATFTVTARDVAGNECARSVTYTVAYSVGVLFDQTKARHSGSTIPIRVQLLDALGNNASAANVVVTAIGISLISNVALGPVDDSGNANPDGNFRFDGEGYAFNLKSTGLATGTYLLHFKCGSDPTDHTVEFQIK